VTTYDLSPEGITAALRTLDAESWEISEKLRAAGVKGTRSNECLCALAVHIGQLIPAATKVYVEVEQVRVEGDMRDEYGFDWPVVLTSRLPDGAQDFIGDFDRGAYPYLDEEDAA
jgi:hypothetical protein